LIALLQELHSGDSEDDQIKSSHFVFIMFILAVILFSVGGMCFRGITSQYYTPTTDTIETVYESQYIPFSWIGFGLALFAGYFLIMKAWDLLDLWMPEV
jgi:hypothetical protein